MPLPTQEQLDAENYLIAEGFIQSEPRDIDGERLTNYRIGDLDGVRPDEIHISLYGYKDGRWTWCRCDLSKNHEEQVNRILDHLKRMPWFEPHWAW